MVQPTAHYVTLLKIRVIYSLNVKGIALKYGVLYRKGFDLLRGMALDQQFMGIMFYTT